MTNSTSTTSQTVTLDQARRIIAEHGFSTRVDDEGNGAVGLYLLMPWSVRDEDGTLRTGEDWEHVADTETGNVALRDVRLALGY